MTTFGQVVADSGPLIVFARVGRLDLLHQVVGELIIPEAVYQEVAIRGEGRPGAAEVAQGAWIQRRRVSNRALLDALPPYLQEGQREAIILAQELGLALLIDERQGRREALGRGIRVLGSLRVLAEAKREGLITWVRPLLETMRSSGYRIAERAVIAFLEEVGEAET